MITITIDDAGIVTIIGPHAGQTTVSAPLPPAPVPAVPVASFYAPIGSEAWRDVLAPGPPRPWSLTTRSVFDPCTPLPFRPGIEPLEGRSLG